MKVIRQTVDLSAYPDLVMIVLGMRMNGWRGFKTIMGLGPSIDASVEAKPDGLLLHEGLTFSYVPLHVGMRQDRRDFESLERFTRSEPHRTWWQNFMRDAGGTGFWHETYFAKGGIDAVYADMDKHPVGIMNFAPVLPARGTMFGARARAGLANAPVSSPVYGESELYERHG